MKELIIRNLNFLNNGEYDKVEEEFFNHGKETDSEPYFEFCNKTYLENKELDKILIENRYNYIENNMIEKLFKLNLIHTHSIYFYEDRISLYINPTGYDSINFIVIFEEGTEDFEIECREYELMNFGNYTLKKYFTIEEFNDLFSKQNVLVESIKRKTASSPN